MSIFSRFFSLLNTGVSTRKYYSSMNQALLRLNEEYTMLHYPYYGSDTESFLQAQANLTDYCMGLLPPLKSKVLLEIGCGNGVQATYILEKYGPGIIKAIDLNVGNIDIARQEAERKGTKGIVFQVDDAHALTSIEDNSVDIVVNIESAFHYSDKPSFLRQVNRVLKPGGSFVIADILSRNTRSNALKDIWNKKMSYHHWVLSSYETELPLAGFFGVNISDITKQVIHSFGSYRRWLRDMKHKHFFDDLMLKLFYTVNARLNIYLLRTSKQYCVFVGRKPE